MILAHRASLGYYRVRALCGRAIKSQSRRSRPRSVPGRKGPLKLEADRAADCWAGIVPIAQRLGAPIPDRRVMPRGEREREIGHLSEGTRFEEVLKRLAR